MSSGPTAILCRQDGVIATNTDFTVVDVETTGLNAASERVIEVAAIRVHRGEIVDEFATLVNPGRPIRNTEFHGITSAHVADAPVWRQLAPILQSYLSDSVMVCHNSVFDSAFLSHEFERVGVDISAIPTLCTLVSARAQLDLWGYKLRSVVGRVTGIWPDFEHTALDDARTTARLLIGLLASGPQPLRLVAPPTTSWSNLDYPSVFTKHRVTAVQRDLVHLVQQLPITSRTQAVDGVALDHYRAALDRAMADRRVDLEEAEELAESIRSGGLTRDAVEGVHRELIDHHRVDVHADGVVTWDEATSLSKIARLVGMPEYVAEEEQLGQQDKATRQALMEWRVVGVGLDDDVAEVLDLAADHAASTGTSITARTSVIVVSDPDRGLPRVRRAENAGKLVMNPSEARSYLLDAVRVAVPAQVVTQARERREPIVRWDEHWRPYELLAEDCLGWFNEDARARALERARPVDYSTHPSSAPARTIEFVPEAATPNPEVPRPQVPQSVVPEPVAIEPRPVEPHVPDPEVIRSETAEKSPLTLNPSAAPSGASTVVETGSGSTTASTLPQSAIRAESPNVVDNQEGSTALQQVNARRSPTAGASPTPSGQRAVGAALVGLGAISLVFATLMFLALLAAITQRNVFAATVLAICSLGGTFLGIKLVSTGRGRYGRADF